MKLLGLRSSLSTFKEVKFRDGLNLIVAERSASASSKDTRNGAGKSSLFLLVDFCLGGTLPVASALREDVIGREKYWLDIELSEWRFSLGRSPSNEGQIEVSGVSPPPELLKECSPGADGLLECKESALKEFLAHSVFEIADGSYGRHGPSYRSVISYFLRKGTDAYTHPLRFHRNQKAMDAYCNVAFLLGLRWELSLRAAGIEAMKDDSKALERVLDSGSISNGITNRGELEAERVRLQEVVERQTKDLSAFRVHPQYSSLESEANALTTTIGKLVNHHQSLVRRHKGLSAAIKEESSAELSSVRSLYESTRSELASLVMPTLEQAEEFYSSVIKHRKAFLAEEHQRLKKLAADVDSKISVLVEQRARVMETLQTHGALDEFAKLNAAAGKSIVALEEVEKAIHQRKELLRKKSEIRLAEAAIETDAEAAYEEDGAIRQAAMSIYSRICGSLYEGGGSLLIEADKRGYTFGFAMGRADSGGISRMTTFCLDLTIMELRVTGAGWPKFLAHDSIIFDGVDTRQVGVALKLAMQRSSDLGKQYICAINSDILSLLDSETRTEMAKQTIVELADVPGGGLFGVEFGKSQAAATKSDSD